jgi:hypothetical protein
MPDPGARIEDPGVKNMPRSHRIAALLGLVLMLSIVTAGCARRDSVTDTGVTPPPIVSVSATPAPPSTPPTRPPDATATSPSATPVPSPDLTAIDGLIRDINDDLDADASAGADEGSTP